MKLRWINNGFMLCSLTFWTQKDNIFLCIGKKSEPYEVNQIVSQK